jgi:hypothetical protein
VTRLSAIPPTPTAGRDDLVIPGEWRQLRRWFGMRELSANAFVATEPGQEIVHEHAERANDDPERPGGEELYVVLCGRALARLDGEEAEVGPGTCVFVGDPRVLRSFTALEAGTTVIAVGTNPGVAFVVSGFEQEAGLPPRWA